MRFVVLRRQQVSEIGGCTRGWLGKGGRAREVGPTVRAGMELDERLDKLGALLPLAQSGENHDRVPNARQRKTGPSRTRRRRAPPVEAAAGQQKEGTLKSASEADATRSTRTRRRHKRIGTAVGTNQKERIQLFYRGTTFPRAFMLALIALQSLNYSTSLIQAFNIDTQSAVVHSGPQGSYFGYSVAQHRDRGVTWLLVGAPKAQTDQPKTKESGAVYRCTPSAAKACQQIPFDPNGSSVINLRDEQAQSDDKSHQWFGASLASANDNGSIVACAPRYLYYSTNLKRRDPVGTCWVSRGSFNGFLEYSPCRLNGE